VRKGPYNPIFPSKIALVGVKRTLKPYFPLEDSSRRCEKDLETLFTSSSHTYTRYY
jgi:hypothetical protein